MTVEDRTYSELLLRRTFYSRLTYLKLHGTPTEETFGGLRHLNQSFYTSREWRRLRDEVVTRDDGLDLGLPGYPIFGKVFVHHMNPVTPNTLRVNPERALDPEYLISVSQDTHLAIHFGMLSSLATTPTTRSRGDTTLW